MERREVLKSVVGLAVTAGLPVVASAKQTSESYSQDVRDALSEATLESTSAGEPFTISMKVLRSHSPETIGERIGRNLAVLAEAYPEKWASAPVGKIVLQFLEPDAPQ